ncbi:MAG: RloB family protein [Streptococcaceae bacterium]|nr:RloB family protein [Streptococcaceae bacterium]
MKQVARRIKKIFTLFVEGQTEKIYFDSLNQLDFVRDSNYRLNVIDCAGADKLLKIAFGKKKKREFGQSDKVAFVVDKDQMTKAEFDLLVGLPYIIGFSNPQFEIWLLAHFEPLKESYSDVVVSLRKYMPNYQKASPEISNLVKDYQKALKNTEKQSEAKFEQVSTSIVKIIEVIAN